MKFTAFVLLLSLLAFDSLAQNFSLEFGKVSRDEIEMVAYDKDKEAEALIIYDIGRTHFERVENSFEIVFVRTTKIKVFSEAGLGWATIEIPFSHQNGIFERVYDIEAISYNLVDGNVVRTVLNQEDWFDERISDSYSIRKFAIPNVRPGSVIEYRYKVRSQSMSSIRNWNFQHQIPSIHSEYILSMIPFYVYTYFLQGALWFDQHNSHIDKSLMHEYFTVKYHNLVHNYVMKNVPAFKDEAFITSINDYRIRLVFQLSKIVRPNGTTTEVISTWPQLIKELDKDSDFGKFMKRSSKEAKKIFNLREIRQLSADERLNIILNYVKYNYNWNGLNEKLTSKSVKAFQRDRIGSSAEINLFAAGLLNAAGIEAYPIILSTRGHGTIRVDYPFSQMFNYVLVCAVIDGEYVLADATDIMLSNSQIPIKCNNGDGLLIKNREVTWISLADDKESEINTNIHIQINGSQGNSTIEVSATNFDGYYFRSIYKDDLDNIGQRLRSKYPSVNTNSLSVENYDEPDLPYILRYSVNSGLAAANDQLIISPFMNETISENPLKQPNRTYPVDMAYKTSRSYNTTIVVPEGYTIESLPRDYNVDNNLFKMNYNSRVENNEIKISFSYSFRQAVYGTRDYQRLRRFFDDIVRRVNERVILSISPS